MDSYLKEFRKSKGLNQIEMAKVLNVSYSHYVKLENKFVNPSVQLLGRLKRAFSDVDMNKFFE